MLGVTYHHYGDVTYQNASFNRVAGVIVKADECLADTVGIAPAVYHKDRIEASVADHLHVAVNLGLGLIVALIVNYNGKTGLLCGAGKHKYR